MKKIGHNVITSKWLVTIPKGLREKFNPGDILEFYILSGHFDKIDETRDIIIRVANLVEEKEEQQKKKKR